MNLTLMFFFFSRKGFVIERILEKYIEIHLMNFNGGIKDWMAGLEQVGKVVPSSQRSDGSRRLQIFFVIFILKRPHSAVNKPYIFLCGYGSQLRATIHISTSKNDTEVKIQEIF